MALAARGAAAAAGLGAASSYAAVARPHSWRNRPAHAGNTWRVLTSWTRSGVMQQYFSQWCESIAPKTNDALRFEPIAGRDIVRDFQAMAALREGYVDAINSHSSYWNDQIPITAFLGSYPMGPQTPGCWDLFYHRLGGLELARSAYRAHGLFFVGPITVGPNILHSRMPVRSVSDFRKKKVRVPPGELIVKFFRNLKARPVIVEPDFIVPGLNRKTLDVADYSTPGVNLEAGLHRAAGNICLGPPGMVSIHQPAAMMDFVVSSERWESLSSSLQRFIEREIRLYSLRHREKLAADSLRAWRVFQREGIKIHRLPADDLEQMQHAAWQCWHRYARTDAAALQALKIQAAYMKSPAVGLVPASVDFGKKKLELGNKANNQRRYSP